MLRFALVLSLVLAAVAARADENAPYFLVARSDLPDPNFEDAVVLMPGTGITGPLGVIVNRPTGVSLAKLFPEIDRLAKSEDKLFFGGPVAPESVSFLFRADAPPDEDALAVSRGVYLSTDEDLLRRLLKSGTSDVRVFAGFAAWGPGQLEREIAHGDWHTLPVDAKSLFERRPATVWPELNRRASSIQVRFYPGPGRSPACARCTGRPAPGAGPRRSGRASHPPKAGTWRFDPRLSFGFCLTATPL